MRTKGMKFRVIVAGGRDFCDYALLESSLDKILVRYPPEEVTIICGEARGADSLGKRYALEHGMSVQSFPAEWDRYGRSAGYVRNIDMADNADALVAFWDGNSRGTSNMIHLARERRLPIRIIDYTRQNSYEK